MVVWPYRRTPSLEFCQETTPSERPPWQAVEEATHRKANVQTIADRFSAQFIPVNFLLALIVYLVTGKSGGSIHHDTPVHTARGVETQVDGRIIRVGSRRFMQENAIELAPAVEAVNRLVRAGENIV